MIQGENDSTFPVLPVDQLPKAAAPERWLIESLWGKSAVGVLCGHPKAGKSWAGLDMAVSVASGTPCLGKFPVHAPGRSLIYLAEDSLPALRERVSAIAAHRGLQLAQLDLQVITAPRVRLDLGEDRARLAETAERLRPRLLLLDPLVRMHRLDENDSREISGLLSFLRELQRQLDMAVTIVHHTRKNATGGAQAGQGIRGSSDIWAWTDSTLYLRNCDGKLLLSMEHRSQPAQQPVFLKLVDTDPERIHLEILSGTESAEKKELCQAVLNALQGKHFLTRTQLRAELRVKNERLGEVLTDLEQEGRIERGEKGWRLKPCVVVPLPSTELRGNGPIGLVKKC